MSKKGTEQRKSGAVEKAAKVATDPKRATFYPKLPGSASKD
jgi:hypothetical protein